MKVDPTKSSDIIRTQLQSQPVDGARAAGAAAQASPVTGLSGKDEAQFSKRAIDLSKARVAVDDVPDMRTEVVNSMRQKVQTNGYQVQYEALANRLVNLLG
jgi:hypothetical protein